MSFECPHEVAVAVGNAFKSISLEVRYKEIMSGHVMLKAFMIRSGRERAKIANLRKNS